MQGGERVLGGGERRLGGDHARLELGDVGAVRRLPVRRGEVVGVRRAGSGEQRVDRSRLGQEILERELAGLEVGRAIGVQPPGAAGGRGAAGRRHPGGVAQHEQLEVARLRARRRCRRGVDGVEGGQAEVGEREGDRPEGRARLVDRARGAPDPPRIAQKAARPPVEHRLRGARGRPGADQPGAGAPAPSRTASRCVSADPLRGKRVTSSSGGGAAPRATASSVPAVRARLPRAAW